VRRTPVSAADGAAAPPSWSRLAKAVAAVATAIAVMAIFVDTAQAQVPTINIKDTCRIAASVTVSLTSGTSQNDEEICVKSEEDARQQLIKDWSTYDAADRKDCVQPDVYLPSYIEWLTCFEMDRVVRQLKQTGQAGRGLPNANPDGSYTLPNLPRKPLY
jgi:hypothetical protein